MIRFGGRSMRGFGLSDASNEDVDSLIAAKLAEGGYPNVSAYQRANGLTVDGVAGHDTLTAMGYGYLFDLAARGLLKPNQTQLETKNTPLTPEQAAQALSVGYQAVTGTVPTPEVLALLLAQSGHETADWQKLPNYAFGGVKASPGDKFVQAFVTGEGNPPKHYVLAFAAYQSPEDGAEAYVRTLKARTNWWNGLQSGTPEGLIEGLTVKPFAYFTGSASEYLASVRRRVAKFADLAKAYARPLSATDVPIHWAPVHWPTPPIRIPNTQQAKQAGGMIFVVSATALVAAAAYVVNRERIKRSTSDAQHPLPSPRLRRRWRQALRPS